MLTPALPLVMPRNCVRVYALDDERVMVLSFTGDGKVLERYEGPRWLVTDLKLEIMRENLGTPRPSVIPALKLVTD